MSEIQKDKIERDQQQGMKYIYPQRKAEWKDHVEKCYQGEYGGREIEYALRFMESLHKNEDVWAEYKKSEAYKLPNDFFNAVLKIVLKYAKRGVEFYYRAIETRYSRIICGREEKALFDIALKNKEFENQLKREEIISENMN